MRSAALLAALIILAGCCDTASITRPIINNFAAGHAAPT